MNKPEKKINSNPLSSVHKALQEIDSETITEILGFCEEKNFRAPKGKLKIQYQDLINIIIIILVCQGYQNSHIINILLKLKFKVGNLLVECITKGGAKRQVERMRKAIGVKAAKKEVDSFFDPKTWDKATHLDREAQRLALKNFIKLSDNVV